MRFYLEMVVLWLKINIIWYIHCVSKTYTTYLENTSLKKLIRYKNMQLKPVIEIDSFIQNNPR